MTINNNNIFGAFTLGEVRSGRLTGEWLNKESVANYGWFGGGLISTFAAISTVDRIDFSNDTATATPRGALSLARVYPAAIGNSNYGWFGSGGDITIPVYYSLVDRVDFSNDSAIASVRGPLNSTRYGVAATGNSNYGWFGGGKNAALYAPIATVDRIDFSNDSATASVRGPLSSSDPFGPLIFGAAATGNSNYGWFGGGYVPSPTVGLVEVSSVNRIDFSNDFSPASVRGPLSSARGYAAATGNSNYGWFGGGQTPAAPAPTTLSIVDRIDFSNDTATTLPRGPLSQARNTSGATGNSNYGWFGGGVVTTAAPPAAVVVSSIVNRIDFSNDSVTASTRGSLTSENGGKTATSGVLNIRRQKAGNFGWFGGGYGPLSTVDRIDFSNDSSTASVRGSLSLARSNLAATGNSNYGWFGGGRLPVVSRVDRIDFSNDSPIASIRGPLSSARYALAATGNSNYGWFGGGYFRVTTVDRIDFSNDSGAVSVRGPLSSARYELVATGNSNYGWFGGGINVPPGPDPFTTESLLVDRIDFSNDSFTASVRGPLSLARSNLAATGNSNYGWFGGGDNNLAIYSTVDRINFSNDSVIASVRGPLSLARFGSAATGNSNYGWFGGGQASGPTVVATVDRINFSNDSVIASVRGPLSLARSSSAATSNSTR